MNINSSNFFRPIAKWSGRLILPPFPERRNDGGVYIEVQNAPDSHTHLLGSKAWVRWHSASAHRNWLQRAVTDIRFDDITRKSIENHIIHPTRLDGWPQVSPLESLAGAKPNDEVQVELDVLGVEKEGSFWVLSIGDEPLQIAGVNKALVRFVAPAGDKRYRVTHYNKSSKAFDGPEEIFSFPDAGTVPPGARVEQSSIKNIEMSPLNPSGWYVYGYHNTEGTFTVQAIEPVEALQVNPTRMLAGRDETLDHFAVSKWRQIPMRRIERTLLDNNGPVIPTSSRTPALMKKRTRELWYPGDVALVVHTFGWRGGERGDSTPLGLVPGHFSFGFAKVVRDEFTGELRFDVVYRQVYGHNREGVIAGAQRWHLYMGSLKQGWMYTVPVSDVAIRIPELTVPYKLGSQTFDPLMTIQLELALMAARYRTGPGNGASLVTPAASCVQDACQALFAAVRRLKNEVRNDSSVKSWLLSNPNSFEVQRFRRLESLLSVVENSMLLPLGYVPKGWRGDNEYVAAHKKGGAIAPHDIFAAIATWKTMLPRRAEIELLQVLTRHGATMLDFQGAMIGGEIPGITPKPPNVIL